MTYPDQTIMAGGDVPGNCFQAALAGVLGVSINAVPHFPLLGIHHWMHACVAWLEAEHGLIVNTSPDETLGKVRRLHIINGQTERGTSHAVIGDTSTGEMAHDPHPSRAGLTFINSRFYFHCKPDSNWRTVDRDGLPPLDGEAVFIGVNTAGFAACFNMMTPDGACLMGTAESCTCVMSCLRWWRVLDRPTATPVGPAGRETGFAYPAGKLANHSGVEPVAFRYKLCGAGGTLLAATNPAKGEKNEHGIYANGVYDVEPLYLASGVVPPGGKSNDL